MKPYMLLFTANFIGGTRSAAKLIASVSQESAERWAENNQYWLLPPKDGYFSHSYWVAEMGFDELQDIYFACCR